MGMDSPRAGRRQASRGKPRAGDSGEAGQGQFGWIRKRNYVLLCTWGCGRNWGHKGHLSDLNAACGDGLGKVCDYCATSLGLGADGNGDPCLG